MEYIFFERLGGPNWRLLSASQIEILKIDLWLLLTFKSKSNLNQKSNLNGARRFCTALLPI